MTETKSKFTLLSFEEFNKLPVTKLESLLKEHANFTTAQNSAELQIRDVANNLLHGICFLYDDEKLSKDNKITKKPVIITKNFEICPQCKSKSFILQPTPKDSSMYGLKTCHKCQYVEIPKEADN